MEIFDKIKVLPAVTIPKKEQAVATAKAILAGGLALMEIPFRTEEAAECIALIRKEVPQMHIGAGTILTKEQLHQAKAAGASFALAPGFNPEVVKEAKAIGLPFIPGVMSPSEVELALELGCKVQKLFPATQAGGIGMLKALAGPYGHTGVQFIPMGGVSLKNMNDYLGAPNVVAVGGSWLATKPLIATGDFDQITFNVREANEQSIAAVTA
ncbi:bifunctional 4-hydroxy-2-oxoglutarate aldolase/2-dehydro-3-deoxy-phosphogluconate aldolase [Persicobacter psychrovividus]|uniref:2-dehydro-3-deoxy-phosphogluconate aldolase n=1 Tax=Persicobacter psychrovividus TaxID=387638 RepID=A0ABM7VJP2_9BACT|nr:2-dehydro-3-deoxy-phosphogluconate aldolase [Persicobacter psychrovividus]